ncbi:MAG: sigma-54-dependent Fis family transcriptional regulator, partial [Nitrospirae bacterium]|nr:sigma-54-dependent Fis family transcriptional regulator [Nitrospirota bacterium]
MEQGSILVVDDEKSQRDILETILEDEGYDVEVSSNTSNALDLIKKMDFDIVLTDLKMPGSDGLDLLQKIINKNNLSCVVIMTAHGTIDTAVEAMKKGAFDYLTKPLERDELLLCLKRAFEKIRLVRENILLHQQLEDRFKIDNMIGSHGKMQEVFKIIKKVANSNSTVLICGESGTGKELAARAVHYNSPRKD